MPIYEYVCEGCQQRLEVKQKFSDPPLASCPRCGQAVTKVISAPAIMFKGSGWYVTDYSNKLKPPGQSESAGKPSNGQKEPAGSKEAATQPATAAPAQAGATAAGTSGGASPASTGSSAPSTSPAAPTTSSSKPSSS